jgi:esterase FrsA
MTQLTAAKEFKELENKEHLERFNLENHISSLCEQSIRFYIGNRDIRVGTDRCFHLVQQLTEQAFQNGVRSPPIELIISPSIGHMGHGTSKEIFHDGAHWLGKLLGAIA